jgi:hypothetical protein
VHNQNGICWNFVELHKGMNRSARVVHVGGWLATKNGRGQPLKAARKARLVMPWGGRKTCKRLGQTMKSFGQPKANIVTMVLVAGPGIAEPHDELNGRRQITLKQLKRA